MNQYEQDMRTQAEYNKKKDDKLEKGMIAAAAILGGIALYNAATNRTVPNETLKSIFDNKLSPNIAKSGDSNIQPMNNIVGINIASNSPDELGRLLTNPGNNMNVSYKGKMFRNAEHAYQTWKSGQFDEVAYNSTAFKPKGSLSVNKDLSAGIMEDILTQRFMQHPELLQQVKDRGGLEFLKASTHKVGNTSDYWTNGGFINALSNAYSNVDKGTQQFKIISGGQTGSDTYGLQIAKELGITTGGTAPVGYLRKGNDGINVKDFGLIEITPEQQDAFTKIYGLTDPWTGRTYYNGKNSDATLWFGKYHGPGYKATQRGAGTKFIDADVLTDAELLSKLRGMHTINIAGSEMKNIQKGEEAAIKERLRRILPQWTEFPIGNSIQQINDDIMNTNAQYVLHQVNNKGVMGAGLAKTIKEDLSDFNIYKNNPLPLGSVIQIPSKNNKDRIYLNLVGQNGYGRDRQYTDYNAVEQGLNNIIKIVPQGSSIAIPYGMGAGLGGGDWNVIDTLITGKLSPKYKVAYYKYNK